MRMYDGFGKEGVGEEVYRPGRGKKGGGRLKARKSSKSYALNNLTNSSFLPSFSV